MINRIIPLALILLLSFVEIASSATGRLSEGYDVTDLDTPPISYSAITVPGYEAITIAVSELKKFSLVLNKYNSIHIRETHKYIYVVFSANEINSLVFGTPPNAQPGIEVQISKENMQVTGTRRE